MGTEILTLASKLGPTIYFNRNNNPMAASLALSRRQLLFALHKYICILPVFYL